MYLNGEFNKNKTKNKFEKIKSNYFIQLVFDNLPKKKNLEINKYNKRIKERIHLDIKDYKEYAEIFSSIEIELIPRKNEFGNFINIDVDE